MTALLAWSCEKEEGRGARGLDDEGGATVVVVEEDLTAMLVEIRKGDGLRW